MTAPSPDARPGTRLRHLELVDVRAFVEVQLEVDPDAATVLTGPNGSGKTTVLEAVAFLGSQRSFRTTARDAMVRAGAERAIMRATLEREGRPLLVEGEVRENGSARTLVNHRAIQGRADLAETVPVTVFSPEDLGIVQGPPARRRDLLDGALRLVDRRAAAELDALDRVLRQRAALLRQASGRAGEGITSTLDVWDERLVTSGGLVAASRLALLDDAQPLVTEAYEALAGVAPGSGAVTMTYVPGWDGDLADALAAARRDDIRRSVTTVGPHRDEVLLRIGAREARTRASQGEQRTLALALRLGLHLLVTERLADAPLLLLDDVFSELDADRSRALVRHLPPGQTLLTTAAALPDGIEVGEVLDVRTLGRRA